MRTLLKISTLLTASLALVPIGASVFFYSDDVSAASRDDWVTENIINDFNFTDNNSMSVGDIQAFLDSKISCDVWGKGAASEYGSSLTRAQYASSRGWAGPPYTCLNMYHEVPKVNPGNGTPPNNYSNPSSIPSGAKSAAWIIKDAANRYRISPRVLLVKIATESVGPLTADNWPLFSQYRYAMGSHCPDSGPGGSANCDPAYAGFSIQIYSAAMLMRSYLNNMDQSWWPYKRPGLGVGNSNFVGWNVAPRGCGGTILNIQNKATAALYTYTPYQPNEAALNNMYGTGDRCSAYGNRNFWSRYWDWFGPTRFTVIGGILEEYRRAGGASTLGSPTMNEYCGLRDGACFQDFAKGSIYWTPQKNRAYTIIGGIKQKWDSLGKEWGVLGYPISGEIYGQGGVSQRFENGIITSGTNGRLYAVRNQMDYSSYGYLGKPREDTTCGTKYGGCYQAFSNGAIYYSRISGAHPIFGGIKQKWDSLGKEWGVLGYPISGEIYGQGGVSQRFENGIITSGTNGRLYAVRNQMDYSSYGYLGKPREDTTCGTKYGGCYQAFSNGAIYYSRISGAHPIFGGIKQKWDSLGKEWGNLGYPISGEIYKNNVPTQEFENGNISWANNKATVYYN